MKHLTATQINDSILSVSPFVFGLHQFGVDRIVDIQSSSRSHEFKKEVRMSCNLFLLLLVVINLYWWLLPLLGVTKLFYLILMMLLLLMLLFLLLQLLLLQLILPLLLINLFLFVTLYVNLFAFELHYKDSDKNAH
jgi:hypothetical protein